MINFQETNLTSNPSKPFESIWSDLMGVPFCQGYAKVPCGDGAPVLTRYLQCGSADKPTLIFLHGTGGHAEAYVRNLAAHGEHFNTYAIDMIGNGLSDKPDVDLEIAVYVEHLRSFMDTMGILKASISGESLGGWVAARFAIEFPQRIERLVLNTTGGNTAFPEIMARIFKLSMESVEDPSWERVRTRLEFLVADKSSVHDDLVATRLRVYSTLGMVAAMRRILVLQIPEIRQRNLLSADEWGSIVAPTLVLWTSHDPTASVDEGRKISEMIPGARFVVMQDCGHWPQFEKAGEFNQIHLGFLSGS